MFFQKEIQERISLLFLQMLLCLAVWDSCRNSLIIGAPSLRTERHFSMSEQSEGAESQSLRLLGNHSINQAQKHTLPLNFLVKKRKFFLLFKPHIFGHRYLLLLLLLSSALSQQNSRAIQLTQLKYTIQRLSQSCATITTINFGTLSSLRRRNPYPPAAALSPLCFSLLRTTPQAQPNCCSAFHLYGVAYSEHFIYMKQFTLCCFFFMTGFFHSAILQHVSVLHSFYDQITFHCVYCFLFIHS